MKRNFIYFLTFLLSTFTCIASYAAEEKYTIDPLHSFVVFRINHLEFSVQTGKWPVNGSILLDNNDPAKSKVDVTIKINSLVTGIAELNKHLEAPLFFDAQKYPSATFASSKVTLLSKDTAEVQGNLTLHGETKPVTLHVHLNKMGQNPVNDKMSVGFSAETVINRSDFGIKGFLPMVGDKVHLVIDVEAQKDSK
jgi:polyisoprenoid-binding protein YceI